MLIESVTQYKLYCGVDRFFKDLNSSAGIDLENIVYYKDETHYFVMTAKKHSLLYKGVLLQVVTVMMMLSKSVIFYGQKVKKNCGKYHTVYCSARTIFK